jgi:hypothetical protein
LLGHPFDIAIGASFHINDNNSTDGEGGEDADQGDLDNGGADETAIPIACGDMGQYIGQVVNVKFAMIGMGVPQAYDIGVGGGECAEDQEVGNPQVFSCDYGKVEGPGTFDGTTATVLGLSISTDSDTIIEGDPTLPDIAVTLIDNNSLIASKIEFKNDVDEGDGLNNDIGEALVTVLDATGKPVTNGTVKIDLVLTNAANKVVRFRAGGKGALTLKGLPLGTAKLVLTRVVKGKKTTAQTSFSVPSKGTKRLSLRLK